MEVMLLQLTVESIGYLGKLPGERPAEGSRVNYPGYEESFSTTILQLGVVLR